MKLYAKVLFDSISSMGDDTGLYVWATPDEPSILKVQHLMKGAPFKTENTTAYHVTVVYHNQEMPETPEIPQDRAMAAQATALDLWETDKGNVLVLSLYSPCIHALHDEFMDEGFTHTFDEYNPHITVAYDVPNDPKARLWIEHANKHLAEHPMLLRMDPCLKGATLD